MDIDASRGRSNAESLHLFRDVLQRLAEQRPTDIAAASTRAPLDSSTPIVRVSATDVVTDADSRSPSASFLVVTPAILRGREDVHRRRPWIHRPRRRSTARWWLW